LVYLALPLQPNFLDRHNIDLLPIVSNIIVINNKATPNNMPVAVIPDVMDDDNSTLTSPSTCMQQHRRRAHHHQRYLSSSSFEGSVCEDKDDDDMEDCYNNSNSKRNQEEDNDEDAWIRRDRERDGRCAECGVQTHTVQFDATINVPVKTPLTIPREVHRGRCLLCHPLLYGTNLSSSSLPSFNYQQQRYLRSITGGSTNSTTTTTNNNSKKSMPPSLTPLAPSAARRVSQSYLPKDGHDAALHTVLASLHSHTSQRSLDLMDVFTAMKLLPHDARVQTQACERLWIFSWEEDTAAAIGRVGGIALLLQAMARFPWNAHLQWCAGEALQNLVWRNDANAYEVCERGGVALLLQAMMRHGDHVGMQQCGCTALANLAASPTGAIRAHLVASGCVYVLVRAWQRCATTEGVVQAAREALHLLGYDSSNGSSSVSITSSPTPSPPPSTTTSEELSMDQDSDDDDV
jgi:hypothetical protein